LAKGDAGKYIGIGLLGAALGAVAGVLHHQLEGQPPGPRLDGFLSRIEVLIGLSPGDAVVVAPGQLADPANEGRRVAERRR